MKILLRLRIVLIGLVAAPGIACAYIGPGAGLTLLGSLIGVVGIIVIAGFGVLLYPLQQLWRRIRRVDPAEAAQEPTAATPESGESEQHRESG